MKSKKPKDPKLDGGSSEAGKPKAQCHEDPESFELVELVEVYTQDGEEKTQAAEGRKQYINLDSALEGPAKPHPEYGREIVLKARVKQKSGKTDKLASIGVIFTFKRTDGPHRTDPANVWDADGFSDDQKEGFGSSKQDNFSANTDSQGWTSPVSFYTSMFGGDEFEISCKLDPFTPGASGAAPKKTGKYVVWRKFWYQMSYYDSFTAVDPTEAETSYKQVFAEMIKANEKKFKEDDFPDDQKARSLMPEYMLKVSGSEDKVAVIGGHNKDLFASNDKLKQTTEKEKPIKAHLIICEYQCDPKGTSAITKHKIKSNGQEVSVSIRNVQGNIVCKPALQGGTLVVTGEWSKTRNPWNKEGDVKDVNIEISKTRASLLTVKVDLSKGSTGAPTPTDAKPIYVKLKVNLARGYLGESFGKGQILCVYRPSAAAKKQGSKEDFSNTVAHELGHMWNQTPRPGSQPDAMENHPLQYAGHGGSGSHCRQGAAYVKQNPDKSWKLASMDADTTIQETSDAAKDTYEVGSTDYFVKDHVVTVNGTARTIKEIVDDTHLQFTESFAAGTGDKVQQKVNFGPANWNSDAEETPSPEAGTCLMYHSFSDRCTSFFCDTCKPYLQLQDMSSLK